MTRSKMYNKHRRGAKPAKETIFRNLDEAKWVVSAENEPEQGGEGHVEGDGEEHGDEGEIEGYVPDSKLLNRWNPLGNWFYPFFWAVVEVLIMDAPAELLYMFWMHFWNLMVSLASYYVMAQRTSWEPVFVSNWH